MDGQTGTESLNSLYSILLLCSCSTTLRFQQQKTQQRPSTISMNYPAINQPSPTSMSHQVSPKSPPSSRVSARSIISHVLSATSRMSTSIFQSQRRPRRAKFATNSKASDQPKLRHHHQHPIVNEMIMVRQAPEAPSKILTKIVTRKMEP